MVSSPSFSGAGENSSFISFSGCGAWSSQVPGNISTPNLTIYGWECHTNPLLSEVHTPLSQLAVDWLITSHDMVN